MKKNKKTNDAGALFIPAGVITGMGFGFLFNNFPAGMFIGLGIGFTIFAIVEVSFGYCRYKDEEKD